MNPETSLNPQFGIDLSTNNGCTSKKYSVNKEGNYDFQGHCNDQNKYKSNKPTLPIASRLDDSFATADIQTNYQAKLKILGTPTLTAIPNPTTGQVTFHYSLFTDGEVSITVNSIVGNKVYEAMHHEFQTSGIHQKESNLSFLPTGVYLVTIETGGYKQTERLVINY